MRVLYLDIDSLRPDHLGFFGYERETAPFLAAFSGQGMRAREIAKQLHLHEEYVRELIRQFNEGGFEALRPRKATGRPSEPGMSVPG